MSNCCVVLYRKSIKVLSWKLFFLLRWFDYIYSDDYFSLEIRTSRRVLSSFNGVRCVSWTHDECVCCIMYWVVSFRHNLSSFFTWNNWNISLWIMSSSMFISECVFSLYAVLKALYEKKKKDYYNRYHTCSVRIIFKALP